MPADAVGVATNRTTPEVAPERGGLVIVGPPGSGKTTALALRAARSDDPRPAIVICSSPSSCRAMAAAVEVLGAARPVVIDTLAGHLARWMRAEYAAAGVAPDLKVGNGAAARHIVERAARGLLDMSWPMLRDPHFDIDVPLLGRPDGFLDEAARLIRLLRRLRIGVEAFARGCASGSEAFYGAGDAAVSARLRDPTLRNRLSRRAREALRASPRQLSEQRRAERDLARILTRLYAEYIAAAAGEREWSEEDVIDHGVAWLALDGRAARGIARRVSAIFVDDAEDAEPALPALLDILAAAGVTGVTLAGCEEAQIGALLGSRSALPGAAASTTSASLTPRSTARAHAQARRFASEADEADWLAGSIADLVRGEANADEIAILARSADSAAIYQRLLAERGAPVCAPSGLFQAPDDVMDLLALAAAVDDARDHEHLLRVLSSPLVGLSDETVWTLCRPAEESAQLMLDVGARGAQSSMRREARRTTLSDNALRGRADGRLADAPRAVLEKFREQYAAWAQYARSHPPEKTLAYLIADAGYRDRWANAPPHARARLSDDGVRLVEALENVGRARPELRLRDAVRLLEAGQATLRAARPTRGSITCDAISSVKGLRFAHVFVAGVAHERFPRIYVPRAIAFTRTFGLIVRENVAGGASQTAKFGWYYARFDAKARYLEGERRILHYGLSRADVSAAVTGFGKPPHWAAAQDLLAEFGV